MIVLAKDLLNKVLLVSSNTYIVNIVLLRVVVYDEYPEEVCR